MKQTDFLSFASPSGALPEIVPGGRTDGGGGNVVCDDYRELYIDRM